MNVNELVEIRCSALPMLAGCPGSLKACEGLESKSSAVADRGTRIHKAIENHFLGVPEGNPRFVELEGYDLRIKEQFVQQAEEVIAGHGGAGEADYYPERLLSTRSPGFKLTGHPDLMVSCADGTWVVFDWKTGWKEQPVASRNLQLMGYACLVRAKQGAIRVEVYLFSAGNKDARFTGTVYTCNEFKAGEEEIVRIVETARNPEAPRVASESNCKYCPAQGTARCPETSARRS